MEVDVFDSWVQSRNSEAIKMQSGMSSSSTNIAYLPNAGEPAAGFPAAIAASIKDVEVSLEPPAAEVKPSRLALVPFDQIRPGVEPPYLVKGLIPRDGISVIWGEPKSGKSFQSYDLAMSIVRGIDYRGRRVQHGPVVYCAAEGATGFTNRVEAYRLHHGIDGALPFFLVPVALDLIAEALDLVAEIRRTLGEVKPLLVVLDTLNRSLAGNENDPGDMAKYIKAADAIREAFGCAVLIVHHCGVDAKRPRGHTSLTGAADAQLAVKRTGETIVTTVEWMKDGPEGDIIYSGLEVVTVGRDRDLDEITSCVVVEAEPAAPTATRRKLGKNEQTMFDILAEKMPDGLTKDAWYKLAREDGLGVRRRSDLGDCRRSLLKKGTVHECQGKWFVTTRS